MMKKAYILTLFILGLSCNETDDIFEEDFTRGGFAQFAQDLETEFNILTFDEETFSAEVIDPNDNITSYSLSLIYGDIVVDDFVVLNSLPGTIQFTGEEALNALNLTVADLELNTPLRFLATITTPDGIFSGNRPAFDDATNTVVGGDTANEIFASAMRQAVDFSLPFFLPPPQKFRGTSFEEPFGTGENYTRPVSEALGELFNNDGERNVQYTAVGNDTDDEIGFRTFMDELDDTSSSPGFTSERIGVSNDPGLIEEEAFLEGNQAYEVSDIDGTLRIQFDRVEIDPSVNPESGVQVHFFPVVTGWEDSDFLRITALVERSGGTSETLVLGNFLGDRDFDDNGLEGEWHVVTSGFLQNITAYTLIIEARTNNNDETIYFDEMSVFIPTE